MCMFASLEFRVWKWLTVGDVVDVTSPTHVLGNFPRQARVLNIASQNQLVRYKDSGNRSPTNPYRKVSLSRTFVISISGAQY